MKPIEYDSAVAFDLEDAVASFYQLERDIVATKPSLKFCYQTGSLILKVSIGAPRNGDVEILGWMWLQVHVNH